MDIGFINSKGEFRFRACAIIIEDGCVLMSKNDNDNYYYSVGGAVKQNESSQEAVKREVFEETGEYYEIDRLAFIQENFFTSNNGDNGSDLPFHEISFYYLMKPKGVKNCNGVGYTSKGVLEHTEWIPLDKYSQYYAYPEFFADKLKNIPDFPQHIVTYEK